MISNDCTKQHWQNFLKASPAEQAFAVNTTLNAVHGALNVHELSRSIKKIWAHMSLLLKKKERNKTAHGNFVYKRNNNKRK